MTNQQAETRELQIQKNETVSFLQVIERVISSPEIDMDKLDRMLAMQERVMERNAAIEFNAAMAEMQCDMPEIAENGKIRVKGQLRSKYATLEDIVAAVKPALKQYGFAISFRINKTEREIEVTGILMHRSGHREETMISLPRDDSGQKNTVQAIGSTVSYGKRYVLSALLNITTRGEDDDAQGAVGPITDEQKNHVLQLIDEAGADTRRLCEHYKIDSIPAMPATAYQSVVNGLKAKIAQNAQKVAAE